MNPVDLGAAELRTDVATANHICHEAGLVNVYGHVTARIPGEDLFLVPTRSSPALAAPDTLLVLDFDGNTVAGSGQPNFEHWIHARIYATRPDVGGVAHVHPPSCVALTSVTDTVRAVHNVGALVADCPILPDLGLIGSRELADHAAAVLGDAPALLLRGHGANVVGTDVRVAMMLACFLEESARRNLDALAAAGGDVSRVRWYSKDEIDRVNLAMSTAVPGDSARLAVERFTDRFWEYHLARLGRVA
jgi:ribulose-5-phosphate 4-epimerase/fuculose-1-phosphate aldolase